MMSHLESMVEAQTERERQLKIAFEEMEKAPARQTVLFGGDLNLRDYEVCMLIGSLLHNF